jgi:GNAT superfamily N-acetyltransferase
MALSLKTKFEYTLENLRFVEVSTSKEGTAWTKIAAESFGYAIPNAAIQKIIGLPKLNLILAFRDNVPVATGLLFENKGVMGIHMVGVLPTHRRLGIAKELMYYLMMVAQKSNSAYATLQASAMGEPLYEALGFEKQFTITNFSNFEI